jgi:hypothetical protein
VLVVDGCILWARVEDGGNVVVVDGSMLRARVEESRWWWRCPGVEIAADGNFWIFS